MTAAFLRLALFAAAATLAAGLAALAAFVSAWVALAAVLGGALLAVAVTLERPPPAEEDEAADPMPHRNGEPERRDRRAIEADARRAREDTEDAAPRRRVP